MSLTNKQYDAIMASYEERQLHRQHLIDARKEEICLKEPAYAALEKQVASFSVARAKARLNGVPDAMAGYRKQIEDLEQQRAAILARLGYPADYLNPPYICPDCKDTGYIGRERCHCLTQASLDLTYAQSHLENMPAGENFGRFSLAYYDEKRVDPNSGISSRQAAEHAYIKCREFVRDFSRNYQNILLFGDTGTGKTFLSNCVARELLEQGYSVIYFSAHQFFEVLADYAFHRSAQSGDDYQNIFHCDLLIIDDLGTEMVNSFTTSQLFICLNERMRNRKSTLISSNLELADIAKTYSERIFSRICDGFLTLHLFGTDIRIRKALERQG